MNPITHALISWGIANVPKNTTRRQRAVVTLGGLIPDVDGLGLVVDLATKWSAEPTRYFHALHHKLHCVGWALACVALAALLAGPGRRLLTAGLVALTFHLHLVCDLVGARSPPDAVHLLGKQWDMPYLLPFSDWQIPAVSWQWQLNAWPNFLITGVFLVLMGWLAVRRGHSILEIVSTQVDEPFVATLRQRFGRAAEGEADLIPGGDADGEAGT